jgi:hypothetical protein
MRHRCREDEMPSLNLHCATPRPPISKGYSGPRPAQTASGGWLGGRLEIGAIRHKRLKPRNRSVAKELTTAMGAR